MTTSISIDIGGRPIVLTKSDRLVGVRPGPGAATTLFPTLDRLDAVATGETLAGFHVVDISQAPRAMEDSLEALRATSSVATGTHVYHTSGDGVPFVPTGEIHLILRDDVSTADASALLAAHGLELIEARAPRELIVSVSKRSRNPIATAAALQQSPPVLLAEPDLATPIKFAAHVLPFNDELLAEQWHLRNLGRHRGTEVGFLAGADARIVAAWELARSLGSPDVVVAVMDDGFDLSHPDLVVGDNVVAPWDFKSGTNDPTADDGERHGTACAGIAIGRANGSGIVGVAPAARFMPIGIGRQICGRSVEQWFDYVARSGAWVASCSWMARAATYRLPTLGAAAIARCARNGRAGLGTVICFAAGNDGIDIASSDGYENPFATHPDVVAVAACTSMDERDPTSNFGARICVAAPASGAGGGLTTSDLLGTYVRNGTTVPRGFDPGGHTGRFGGTSAACAVVAGVCALVLSVDRALTSSECRSLLQRTARQIGDKNKYDGSGHSLFYGYGCVDAESAVRELLAGHACN